MRHAVLVGLLVIPAVMWASPALARQQSCDLLPGAREAYRTAFLGREMIHIAGPASFVCTGGVRMRADSVVTVQATDLQPAELRFIGNAYYSDSVKVLEAWRIDYEEARIRARGDVVLTDLSTGSVIRSEFLEHHSETDYEPARTAFGGRPHAVLHQRGGPETPSDQEAESVDVHADWIETYGDKAFRARGNVELTRAATSGFAEELDYFQAENLLVLKQQARVVEEDFRLVARRIDLLMDEGDHLRQVVGRQAARLEAEELQVDAVELQLLFEAGQLEYLIGRDSFQEPEPVDLPPPRPPTLSARSSLLERTGVVTRQRRDPPDPPDPLPEQVERPRVITDGYLLQADSIEAHSPQGKLERIHAHGNAESEAVPDSVDSELPHALARDWIHGDTLLFFFTVEEVDSLPADSVVREAPAEDQRRVVERIVAIGEGGKARALQRGRTTEDGVPTISYTVADRIVAWFSHGEVVEIEAEGRVMGIHGEAVRRRDEVPDRDSQAKPKRFPES